MKFPGEQYVDIDAQGVAHVAPPGFPGDGLCRALRCSRSGQLIAGFDQSDNVYEWRQGKWHPQGQSFGGRAVIYVGEILHVRRESPGVGYRYVRPDNSIVTAEETYAHPTLKVWEYTTLANGWIVGQGGQGGYGEDPLVILPGDGTRRLVRIGTCRFVNAYLVGDRIDIAWQETGGCDALSLTLTEVLALPMMVDDGAAPTPNPPPPTPKPEDPVADYPPELEDQRALVIEVRNALFPDKIDQPLNDTAKAMLMTKHVAWRLRQYGVGLAKAKPGSENNVDGYTSDIVALANGVHWDIQVDGHAGAAFATWALEDDPANYPPIAARWTPAVDPGGVVPDPVTPVPNPGTGSIDALVAAQIAAALAPLKAEIAELRDRPAPEPAPAPEFPRRIALKGAHGMYLVAEPSGQVLANRGAVGGWEIFDVEPQ